MISMKKQLNILITIVLIALLMMSLPGAIFCVQAAEDPEGGTDPDIRLGECQAGGSGEFLWNQMHGFVMIEDQEKVDEPFNISISEDVKYYPVEDKWKPQGHIYGELHDIIWYEEGEDGKIEPWKEISLDDFYEYSDDGINLTVYVLGEYWREQPGEDELRQAYKEVLVQRPNHAPTAVPWVVDSDEYGNGNWSGWKNISDPQDLNEDGELVYYISSEGIDVQFYLNASHSWDVDGDNITDWRWDLDGDGHFGQESRERKENTTVYLGVGDHILGLMVGDGNKYSSVVDIRIVIRTPIRYPDLTINEISVVNIDGLSSEIYKEDRAKITAHVKNIGDNESNEKFDVYFEYKFLDTNEPFMELGTDPRVTVTETILVNGLKLVEAVWDTGSDDFYPGNYTFRATVDPDEEVRELREQNNVFESDENITLFAAIDEGIPSISIVNPVEVSKYDAWVNEIVYINITLENTGTGDARYVDILYYIDGEWQHTLTVINLAKNSEETTSFVFSGDTNKTYKLRFEIKDNGVKVDETDTYSIKVEGNIPGPGDWTEPDTPEGDDEGNEMIPIIIAVVVVVGGIGGAGFFFMKKKDEDVW
jgi:hypothetical protein